MVAEKAVDLRMDPKSFSATFTAAIRTIQPIFAQRKREHSNGWKRRKKAKLVSHTAWSGPSAPLFPPTPHCTIQPSNPCQPSPTTHTQTTGRLSHQLIPNHYPYPRLRASSRLRKNYLRLLQAHPQSKSQNSQASQTSALPFFGMIMPISGGSTLEFQNKK